MRKSLEPCSPVYRVSPGPNIAWARIAVNASPDRKPAAMNADSSNMASLQPRSSGPVVRTGGGPVCPVSHAVHEKFPARTPGVHLVVSTRRDCSSLASRVVDDGARNQNREAEPNHDACNAEGGVNGPNEIPRQGRAQLGEENHQLVIASR
jgi:hypothetical protein